MSNSFGRKMSLLSVKLVSQSIFAGRIFLSLILFFWLITFHFHSFLKTSDRFVRRKHIESRILYSQRNCFNEIFMMTKLFSVCDDLAFLISRFYLQKVYLISILGATFNLCKWNCYHLHLPSHKENDQSLSWQKWFGDCMEWSNFA